MFARMNKLKIESRWTAGIEEHFKAILCLTSSG